MRPFNTPPPPKPFRPERTRLTERQLDRLATVSGVPRAELEPEFPAVAERLKFIDPELLFFRRICGRVVKRDPVSGLEIPVASSTVHVEDTDCRFLGLFPVEGPWCWLFPVTCHRETIATVQTDDCGNFCVLVPRFEIDWILRWRLRLRCYPLFLYKPVVRELLDPRALRVPPGPGPVELRSLAEPDGCVDCREAQTARASARGVVTVESLRHLEPIVGSRRLAQLAASLSGAGTSGTALADRILDAPAFHPRQGQPPIPPELHELARDPEGLAGFLRLKPDQVRGFHARRWLGPFWRCQWTLYPTLTPIFDVPDITFRVTQDTNGDGVPETIYSESFGDVRWNSGNIPPVVLVASDAARRSIGCGSVPAIDCGVDPLGINIIGDYPVQPDAVPPGAFLGTEGYAVRVNRPHPNGLSGGAPEPDAVESTAPFAGTLVLRGCNGVEGATHYRVKYRLDGGSEQVFTAPIGWYIERNMPPPRDVIHILLDAEGWTDILDQSTVYYLYQNILLDWEAAGMAPGKYELWLEFKNAGGILPVVSPVLPVQTDNRAPALEFLEVSWQSLARGPFVLPDVCAIIHRQPGETISLSVRYRVSADHLRAVSLTASGCGAGSPAPAGPAQEYDHYYTDPTDTTVLQTAEFTILPTLDDGAYGVNLAATSRAFYPTNADGADPLAHDWNIQTSLAIFNNAYFPIAIVTDAP